MVGNARTVRANAHLAAPPVNSLVAWISQRLLAEAPTAASAALLAALAERDRLTRDTHHQVQNSLQIVASMIALQAHDSDSPEMRRVHAVIQAQIQTLTLVQRWMYGEDATMIDLAGMTAELCTGLEASLASAAHPRVQISCTCAAIALHPDLATPMGFLLTELAILAAHHSPAGPLKLAVSATATADKISVRVACAGFAGNDPVTAMAGKSTARIILAMARQLQGQLTHDAAAGAYSVEFPPLPA